MCMYTKETMCAGPFNIQRILCKKESEEVLMLIWIDFNSFTITYLQKFPFPIEIKLKTKGPELVSRPVFVEFFDDFFSFVI